MGKKITTCMYKPLANNCQDLTVIWIAHLPRASKIIWASKTCVNLPMFSTFRCFGQVEIHIYYKCRPLLQAIWHKCQALIFADSIDHN